MNNMLYFDYEVADYHTFLAGFAAAMKTTIDETGQLNIPPAYGKGYLKVLELPHHLQAIMFDFSSTGNLTLKRIKSTQEYYTLSFDEMQIDDNSGIGLDEFFLAEPAQFRSRVSLTSSLVDVRYIGHKGTVARGVHILINNEWMSAYLGISKNDTPLSKYIELKTSSLNFEPLDAEYRQLLTELLDVQAVDQPMQQVIIQNRVMLLIERFFNRLYLKMESLPNSKKISEQEIQQLMMVEYILVKDVSKPPPTLPELARLSMMSQTKLKGLFKKIYDLNPYEYYQRNRMYKARYLLNTQQFSIKQVGIQLGFKNMSNFTIAFKKEFGILPKDV